MRQNLIHFSEKGGHKTLLFPDIENCNQFLPSLIITIILYHKATNACILATDNCDTAKSNCTPTTNIAENYYRCDCLQGYIANSSVTCLDYCEANMHDCDNTTTICCLLYTSPSPRDS